MKVELIKWDESLSTGVKIFDDQHKKLFDMMNGLFNAIIEKHSKDVIGPIVENLLDYTNTHFKDEEREMLAINYDEYYRHKTLHDQFLHKIGKFKEKYEFGEDITVELFIFLKEWIINHIMKEDKKYTPHFTRVLERV